MVNHSARDKTSAESVYDEVSVIFNKDSEITTDSHLQSTSSETSCKTSDMKTTCRWKQIGSTWKKVATKETPFHDEDIDGYKNRKRDLVENISKSSDPVQSKKEVNEYKMLGMECNVGEVNDEDKDADRNKSTKEKNDDDNRDLNSAAVDANKDGVKITTDGNDSAETDAQESFHDCVSVNFKTNETSAGTALDNILEIFSISLIQMRKDDDDTRKDRGSPVTEETFTDRESEKLDLSHKLDGVTRRVEKLTFGDEPGDEIKISEIPAKDDIRIINEKLPGDPKQPATAKNQQRKLAYLSAPKRSGCGLKIDREALVVLQTNFEQPQRHRKEQEIEGDRNHANIDPEPENKRQVTFHPPRTNIPHRNVSHIHTQGDHLPPSICTQQT